jgi:hypothetical protein
VDERICELRAKAAHRNGSGIQPSTLPSGKRTGDWLGCLVFSGNYFFKLTARPGVHTEAVRFVGTSAHRHQYASRQIEL